MLEIGRVRRLPQWPAVRPIVKLGLCMLLASGLVACTTPASPPFGPPNGLRLSDDHSEIIMTGVMQDGLSAAVKQMLDATPTINAIRLESPGGRASEGYSLALLVKQYHLATFSARLCASACTFAYMAGEPRFLATGGKLGFHSSSMDGVTSSTKADAVIQVLYQEAGVPQAFIDKALSTAPKDIWYPTVHELATARVITDLVDDQNFLPSSRKYWTSETDLDRQLKTDLVIATVAQLDPDSFTKLRNLFLEGARQRRGLAQMEAAMRDFVSGELMPSYYRRAPDDVLIRYERTRLYVMHYLEQNAPATCVTMLAPKASIGVDSDDRWPKQIDAQFRQAMADIIIAAVQRPDHPEDDALNRRASQNFWQTMLTKSQDYEESLNALKKDRRNELYCRVLELRAQIILDQSPAIAARIIRGNELKPERNKPHELVASH